MQTEKEVNEQAELDQTNYRKRCTHSRKGSIVRELETGHIVYDGSKECKGKSCIGSNAAKRYVIKNGLTVYKEAV